jgi:hypothetical protein
MPEMVEKSEREGKVCFDARAEFFLDTLKDVAPIYRI